MNSLVLYHCESEKCLPDHAWGPGVKPDYTLHIILSGKGLFYYKNTAYHLKKGDGFLIEPNQICYYRADSEDPWEYAWICFSGNEVDYIFQLCGIREKAVFPVPDLSLSFNRMLEMEDAFIRNPEHILEIRKHLYGFFSTLVPPRREAALSSHGYVQKATHFIKSSYFTDLKITDIAAHVGICRSHLYRLFMSELNMSPQAYLIQYRLSIARRLLIDTDASMTEIAYSCGFHDSQSFCRQFKRTAKMSPGNYRKKY